VGAPEQDAGATLGGRRPSWAVKTELLRGRRLVPVDGRRAVTLALLGGRTPMASRRADSPAAYFRLAVEKASRYAEPGIVYCRSLVVEVSGGVELAEEF
jgi:hypothetical protein